MAESQDIGLAITKSLDDLVPHATWDKVKQAWRAGRLATGGGCFLGSWQPLPRPLAAVLETSVERRGVSRRASSVRAGSYQESRQLVKVAARRRAGRRQGVVAHFLRNCHPLPQFLSRLI